MFCPKCGCLLPEDATVCTECGRRIEKDLRESLNQEQPPKVKEIRTKKTLSASGYEVSFIIGAIACIGPTVGLFLPWVSSMFTGIELVLDRPPIFMNREFIYCAPLIAAVLAAAAGPVLFCRKYRPLLFPMGLAILANCCVFSMLIGDFLVIGENHVGYLSAGIGTYLSIFCGAFITLLGINRFFAR